MAMTVNGMIAKENHETPWSDEEWASFELTLKDYSAIVIGRKTYEIMKAEGDFDSMEDQLVVVLTNQFLEEVSTQIVFASSTHQVEKLLREKEVEKALVCGGGEINATFLKAGLIDEITLDIESLIFGKGIPLVASDYVEVDLDLITVTKVSEQLLQLKYKVKK